MSLNKFTHILLLKNDAKLNFFFFKVTNNYTKTCSKKKSHPVKIEINYHSLALKNQKKKKLEKKKEEEREAMLIPKKKKSELATWLPKKKERQKEGQRCYPEKKEERKKNAT